MHPITVRIAPGISAPVPRLRKPTRSNVNPGITTNSGQPPPASKPVNWTISANRPRTTRTIPSATVDPTRRWGVAGAAYAGAWGWYAGAGVKGALTIGAGVSSLVSEAGVFSTGGGGTSAAGVVASSGATSALIVAPSEPSPSFALPGANTSGLPARMSELTWTVGSPSVPSEEAGSFGVRLRLLIGPPAYT